MVLERKAPGGQAGTSSKIENYPGFPMGLSGNNLAGQMVCRRRSSAHRSRHRPRSAEGDLESRIGYPVLHLDNKKRVSAKCLLIASGASYCRLKSRGWSNSKVSESITTQHRWRRKCATASWWSSWAPLTLPARRPYSWLSMRRKVILLVRGNDLGKGMSRYLSRRIEQTKNIEVLSNTEISGMMGRTPRSHPNQEQPHGGNPQVETPAVFTLIGAVPHTEWLPEGIETDKRASSRPALP